MTLVAPNIARIPSKFVACAKLRKNTYVDLRGKIPSASVRVLHGNAPFVGLCRVSTLPMHSTSQAAPSV